MEYDEDVDGGYPRATGMWSVAPGNGSGLTGMSGLRGGLSLRFSDQRSH